MDNNNVLEMSRSRRHQGDLQAAEQLLRDLLVRAPNHAAALHELGALMVQKAGFTKEAEDLFRRAVAIDKRVAIYHRSLGVTLMQRDKLMDAEGPFREAVFLAPHAADAHFNYGTLLLRQKRLFEAEMALKTAALLAPNDEQMVYTHARALAQLNRLTEAEEAYRRCLSMNPGHFDALVSFVELLRDTGRIEEAEVHARKSLQVATDGQRVSAMVRFARCHRFQPNDPEIAKIESLLATTANLLDRRSLLASLGKAHEDMGEYDQAFNHFRAAKESHAQATGERFDPKGWRELIGNIKQAFPSQPISLPDEPVAGITPIFVAGLSRAGKSLLESLLVQHPDVFAAGEITYWDAAIRMVLGRNRIKAHFPSNVAQLDAAQVKEIGRIYLDNLARLLPTARFIVETNPRNLLYVGLIFSSLPSARVVLCQRDPLDLCLNMYFTQYRRAYPQTYHLDDLGEYYISYQRLADHWNAVFGNRIFQVNYEEMVRNPLGLAEGLRDYCGLDQPGQSLRADFSTQHIGKWRNYEPHLGTLIKALGNNHA